MADIMALLVRSKPFTNADASGADGVLVFNGAGLILTGHIANSAGAMQIYDAKATATESGATLVFDSEAGFDAVVFPLLIHVNKGAVVKAVGAGRVNLQYVEKL